MRSTIPRNPKYLRQTPVYVFMRFLTSARPMATFLTARWSETRITEERSGVSWRFLTRGDRCWNESQRIVAWHDTQTRQRETSAWDKEEREIHGHRETEARSLASVSASVNCMFAAGFAVHPHCSRAAGPLHTSSCSHDAQPCVRGTCRLSPFKTLTSNTERVSPQHDVRILRQLLREHRLERPRYATLFTIFSISIDQSHDDHFTDLYNAVHLG